VLSILFAGGDRTGLPMYGLVSYEEQDTSSLESLDTDVGVVRIRAVRRRLGYGWVLAGEPYITKEGSPVVGSWTLKISPSRYFAHNVSSYIARFAVAYAWTTTWIWLGGMSYCSPTHLTTIRATHGVAPFRCRWKTPCPRCGSDSGVAACAAVPLGIKEVNSNLNDVPCARTPSALMYSPA
jgi:hypothetical protein